MTPASCSLGGSGRTTIEREYAPRCRQADVLEGEPPQDQRHHLQRNHREANDRHERDQPDAGPRQR